MCDWPVVVHDVAQPLWGANYASPVGASALWEASTPRHRFGGSSWDIVDYSPVLGGPTLILTLNLGDPFFSDLLFVQLRSAGLGELPLCSYLVCDIGIRPQCFQVIPHKRQVVLLRKDQPFSDVRFPEWSHPLPESMFALDPMLQVEYPTTENAYWEACELFVGGNRFVRVFGPPLWMYAPVHARCRCGRDMCYVCSIGYEHPAGPSRRLHGRPFFVGEFAMYWFMCPACLLQIAMIQDT